MSDGQPPLHLGGPLGLAGLAMLAGATGIFVMAGSGGPAPAPQPAISQSSKGEPVKPAPELHPGDPLPMVQPAEIPASAETSRPAGRSSPRSARTDRKSSISSASRANRRST